MPRYLCIFCALLLSIVLLSGGCGNNSTGNNTPARQSAIAVTIQDDRGEGLTGFVVTTMPATHTVTVDSSGVAVIDGIAAGAYTVSANRDGYPAFSRTVTVGASAKESITLTYLRNLTVTVKDDAGRNIGAAAVSTIPASDERMTDSKGLVEFVNMPKDTLQFVVHRTGYPEAKVKVNLTGPAALVTIPSGTPVVQVISPQMDITFHNPRGIRLVGKGSDIEDGDLEDEAMVWFSNLDGELGTGKELVVPYLSNGYHIITLQGYDSDGKHGEAVVSFTVFDYQLDSYFPIPAGETWGYRYLVPEFWLTNSENVSVYWSLKGLNVKVDNKSRRTVDIYWDTTAQQITTHFRLTLSDSLVYDNGDIYILQTSEESREWSGSTEKPHFTMHVVTRYSPRYLFLKNTTDVAREPNYESTVRAETSYYYVFYNNTSETYQESDMLTTSVQVGGEETIQTDKGLLKARGMTIRQRNSEGSSEKKWYLARGLGLIRIEDSALDISSVGVLTSASIFRFYSPLGKSVASAPVIGAGSAPRFDLRIDRNNPDDLRKLHRLLTGMLPR